MSLSSVERDQIAREFEQNLQESGLTLDELRQQSGLDEDRFMRAFLMSERGSDPVDVWLIRDLLETAVKHNGGTFTPITKLTEENRRRAAGWFSIKDRR